MGYDLQADREMISPFVKDGDAFAGESAVITIFILLRTAVVKIPVPHLTI